MTSPGAVDGRSMVESMRMTYMPLGITGLDLGSPFPTLWLGIDTDEHD